MNQWVAILLLGLIAVSALPEDPYGGKSKTGGKSSKMQGSHSKQHSGGKHNGGGAQVHGGKGKTKAKPQPTRVTSIQCESTYMCSGSCDTNNQGSCLTPFNGQVCQSGWWGVDTSINFNWFYATVCDQACPTVGQCATQGCDAYYGTCLQNYNAMCKVGWWGMLNNPNILSSRSYTCDLPCLTTQYCSTQGCDAYYGTCLINYNAMCQVGWWGALTTSAIVSSRAYTCNVTCSAAQMCSTPGCDSWYGTCLTGYPSCKAGWWGVTTSIPGILLSRSYVCTTPCDTTVTQHCALTTSCDSQYGACLEGPGAQFCVTGWWGYNSETLSFTCGQSCSCASNCLPGCNQQTGQCMGCPSN